MFEVQIYSTILFLASGFLIAVCFELIPQDSKKELNEPVLTIAIIVLGIIVALVCAAATGSNNVFSIICLIAFHLAITSQMCAAPLRSILLGTTATTLFISLCAAISCLVMAAFRFSIDSIPNMPAVVKTWLTLFGIGLGSAVLTRVLVRTLAPMKRAASWLLQLISGLGKPSNWRKREGDSASVYDTFRPLSENTYSVVDSDFWKELAEVQTTAAENAFRSPSNSD